MTRLLEVAWVRHCNTLKLKRLDGRRPPEGDVTSRAWFRQSPCSWVIPLFFSTIRAQSCPRVHFVWPNPTQPISWLTQPNPLQLEKFGRNPTQPNTTNNRAYSLVVTYFYTRNLSVSGTCQIGRKIKFNCLVKPNLIQPCFKCINVVLSNF